MTSLAVVAAGLLAGAAVRFAWPGPTAARTRLHRARGGRPTRSSRPGRAAGPTAAVHVRSRVLVALLAASVTALVLGGAVGLCVGVLVAILLERWLRRLEPAHVRARRLRLTRELPWVADLLAAAVAGGASPEGALAAVAHATGPPLGEQLRAVTAAVQLGAHPRQAWSTADPALAGLGRAMVRAGERGTPAADQLSRLAEDLRAASRATSAAAVRAAAVQALAPLGACFLPAFLALAVLPMVSGIATQLLG